MPSATKLRVWSWWQHDHWSGKDLAFVVAVSRKRELEDIRTRFGLDHVGVLELVRPRHPGFAVALETPSRLRWMMLDGYASRSRRWLSEEQLVALRALPTAVLSG